VCGDRPHARFGERGTGDPVMGDRPLLYLISCLLDAGIPVSPVSLKLAGHLRKTSGAKTGRFELADLRRLAPDTAVIQELKTLTRDQDALVHMHTRLVTQWTACLKESFPAVLYLFATLQQRSPLVFV
jgi:hypothetical protein